MQDDFSTDMDIRTSSKTKKSGNGKWVQRQEAEMDNEAITPSTLAPHTTSTPSVAFSESHAASERVNDLMGTARTAYDTVVSRGSEILSKVDLSRGTNIVREYPIQAAVGGLIVGFLLGAAVFRRAE